MCDQQLKKAVIEIQVSTLECLKTAALGDWRASTRQYAFKYQSTYLPPKHSLLLHMFFKNHADYPTIKKKHLGVKPTSRQENI